MKLKRSKRFYKIAESVSEIKKRYAKAVVKKLMTQLDYNDAFEKAILRQMADDVSYHVIMELLQQECKIVNSTKKRKRSA